jgi:hypothetical protein
MSNVYCHELIFQDNNNDEQTEIVKYSPNPEHRNSNPCKSQWKITENEEIECFKITYNKGWTKEKNAWGLHYSQNTVTYLGIGEDRSIKLFIAKFKNDVPHNTWHGYPADYQKNAHDIPDKDVLFDWIKNNVLTKAKIRKIMAGQPCKL